MNVAWWLPPAVLHASFESKASLLARTVPPVATKDLLTTLSLIGKPIFFWSFMSTFQPKQRELGIVNGVPLPEMPEDLFIPPQALEICLETFTGPMDLLLYLIKKQNINILDLEVSKITDQYIDYINLMDSLNFELAAEYLVMAATLAEIKSRMLLPKVEEEDDELKKKKLY